MKKDSFLQNNGIQKNGVFSVIIDANSIEFNTNSVKLITDIDVFIKILNILF